MPEFEFMHSVMISGILNECKRAHCTTRVGHVGIKLGSCLLKLPYQEYSTGKISKMTSFSTKTIFLTVT